MVAYLIDNEIAYFLIYILIDIYIYVI